MQEDKPEKMSTSDSSKTKKTFFVRGSIPPEKIAASISAHSRKKNIGAHSIFLGQVRADKVNDDEIAAIEFTSYEAMAEEQIAAIREEAIVKYELTCAHVLHSQGTVKAGEICLFVFTSSPHRHAAVTACTEIVERIKAEVPVFGKEIFESGLHQWKKNQTI